MPENCEHWHRVIAERALRPLDPATEAAAAAHIDSCAEARALATEFAATAAALAAAAVDRRSDSTDRSYVPSPDRMYDRIATRLTESGKQRRRRTLWSVGIAAAAAIIAVLAVGIIVSNRNAVSDRVSLTNEVVDGTVSLEDRSWGTEIHLEAQGFTPGQQYNVWLERADGSRVGAGTFTGVTHPPVAVTLSSALAQSHAVAIGISLPDGTVVIRTSLT